MSALSHGSEDLSAGHSWEREFLVGLEGLSAAMRDCTDFLRAERVPEEGVFAVNLALEELITNALKYGYGEDPPRCVFIRVNAFADRVTLLLEDDANPFDPFGQPEPDLERPAEERAPGGLGLRFVKRTMTSHAYRREGGRNIILLEKRWEKSQGTD